MTTADVVRYNVRMALVDEIDRWLGRRKAKDSPYNPLLRHVRDLLSQDMSPWFKKKSVATTQKTN